jgi:hypothetical protein
MRKLFSVIMLLLAGSVYGQVFPTDTVVKTGTLSNRINYVYLSDGYQSTELNTFTTDVTTINNKLFLSTPFKEYVNYFNIFQVRVPSAESGAKHPNSASDCPAGGAQPIINPKNYFGSRFDVSGIHRLVVPDSFAKLNSVLATNFPAYDQALIVVNSQFYGGSGGVFATSTTNVSSAEVSIHELGHSFGLLADEYWAGSIYAAEKPNMTAQSDPLLVKWKNWVGTNNVGVYPYTSGTGWFRPVQNNRCKMEVLGVSFCSVCTEALIEKIHTLVNPIDGFTPSNASPIPAGNNVDLGFKLRQVLPVPNTLKTTWQLDGTAFAWNVDTATLQASSLTTGTHTLLSTVIDTTLLSRSVNHISVHIYNTQWTISRVTGISAPELYRANLKVFPNPTANDLVVKYELEKKANVAIELLSPDGKRILRHERKAQLPGIHSFTIDTRKLGISSGIYFVAFSINGNTLTKEVLKVE